MPVQPQGRASGQGASEKKTVQEGVAAPPFPDADLMYIVDLLPPEEQSRYQEIRDFLQSRIRAASIDY